MGPKGCRWNALNLNEKNLLACVFTPSHPLPPSTDIALSVLTNVVTWIKLKSLILYWWKNNGVHWLRKKRKADCTVYHNQTTVSFHLTLFWEKHNIYIWHTSFEMEQKGNNCAYKKTEQRGLLITWADITVNVSLSRLSNDHIKLKGADPPSKGVLQSPTTPMLSLDHAPTLTFTSCSYTPCHTSTHAHLMPTTSS